MSKLQGLCYKEFSRDPDYMLAWMAEHVLNYIITYIENDLITTWCKKHHLHHHISLDNVDGEHLQKMFRELQRRRISKNKLSSKDKFKIVFSFLGGSFHYEHQHKDLYFLVEEHNKNNSNDLVDLKYIKKWCNNSKLLHEKRKNVSRYEPFCHLTFEGGK